MLVGRRYGPDVTIVERALEQVFTRYAVDTARIAVGGFSDGASYALSLGIPLALVRASAHNWRVDLLVGVTA